MVVYKLKFQLIENDHEIADVYETEKYQQKHGKLYLNWSITTKEENKEEEGEVNLSDKNIIFIIIIIII